MRFILSLFTRKPVKSAVPASRLQHAGFSAEERKNLALWRSDAYQYNR